MKGLNTLFFSVLMATSFVVNSQITSTLGLEKLTQIQGDLIISGTQLTDVDGLYGLNHVVGDVIIRNNATLINYCGLENLFVDGSIDGDVIIEGNEIDLDVANLDFSNCTELGTNDKHVQVSNFYPNPVVDYLHFPVNENVQSISVFNTVGELIISEENKTNKIDLSGLSSGHYTVKVLTLAGETQVTKIIKK